MIGEKGPIHEEEPELKVTDRRKFNADGSLREGVVIEAEEEKPTAPEIGAESSKSIVSPTEPLEEAAETAPDGAGDLFDDDNPASFINFLSTLVTNAAAALGAMPHPVTGQKSVDLDSGRYWIDVLTMLREKTKNNLNSQEKHLLESILSDLQMQYVSLSRVAEQKLKAQAAQKFSSKDILGK